MKQAIGFTLVEMLVTIGVIAVVVGLLLPALASARRAAGQAQCASNLRQWAIAVNAYSEQYNHWLPRRGQGQKPGAAAQLLATDTLHANWFNVLPPFLGGQSYDDLYFNSGPTPQIPQIGDTSVWICPELYGTAANGCVFGYAMNMALSVEIAPYPDRIDKVGSAATMVFMADGPVGFCSTVPFISTPAAPACSIPWRGIAAKSTSRSSTATWMPMTELTWVATPPVIRFIPMPATSPRYGGTGMFQDHQRLGEGLEINAPKSVQLSTRKGESMSMRKMRNRNLGLGSPMFAAAITAAGASSAYAGLLATESFPLPYGPGNASAAPYMDMVLNTAPLSTWSEKGAAGLQGPNALNPNDPGNATAAAIVAFKFNIGATIDSLNATYGAGNWTITAPALTMQYTYYANNSVFGGGAGTFETYWVGNNSWAFNGSSSGGNSTYGTMKYVAGADPAYATTPSALLTWAGSDADLGATTYNWLSPANNPNYTSWSTDKTGANQGLLTDTLTADPLFLSAINSASAATNPNVSLYLLPTSSNLGLTIFTGGGNSTPTLSFDVVSVPEPAVTGLAMVCGLPALLRRRRRR